MNAYDKVNILLVDDQPSKLLSYEAILADLGENLIKAESGREALNVLLKQDVAVILVDVCMPEQDGFELAEMIRQHHRFKHTAIIFVSAVQLDDLDRVRGYATGAVDYVTVPIVPEILRAKVAVFVDLHRKTRLLEEMNNELERRVSERTAELRAAQETLREADRRKDQFLAVLAHELRNPLAPIQNSLEVLRRLPLENPQVNSALETMGRQLSQMTRLIDDLMDVSRITRGKLELRMEAVKLSDLVSSAIELARPLIEASRHELDVRLPREEVYLEADPMRIAQVLSNLLNNAARYTPARGKIQIAVESQNGRVQIRVLDNGIGVSEEILAHLFEPFFQADPAVERSNGGLGIGLTIVRSLVELHGGSIAAFSQGTGKGTEFVLDFVACSAPRPRTEAQSPPPTLPEHPGAKVLVVDDNRDAAESLALLLATSGHEVAIAHDGLQALKEAEAMRPELVLMDIGMPGMSGYETAKRLRRKSWARDLVLIALTGWGQDEDRRRTAEAGFDHHLVKPVEFEVVNRLFSELRSKQDMAPVP